MAAPKLILNRINSESSAITLFVDLDGTLLKTDTIFELLILLMKHHFFSFLLAPFWLMGGFSYFKRKLSSRVILDPETLPYNMRLLNYLRKQSRKGRVIYLATGSFHREAQAIADYLGIFQGVLASDESVHMIGKNKLQAIKATVGNEPFAYAGNSGIDLFIWHEAEQAIVVKASKQLHQAAANRTEVIKYIPPTKHYGVALFSAMRVYQWVKNSLLFAPVILSNRWMDFKLDITLFLGFMAFNLVASAVYVWNDLLDVGNDRKHPTKRKRPFAAGDLPIWSGFLLIPLLLAGGFSLAYSLQPQFFAVLGGYFLLTCVYSFYLKSVLALDIICLALLYTWRILAGGVLAQLEVSPWLLAFSGFLFFSLALAKRSAELTIFSQSQPGNHKLRTGREYQISDLPTLNTLGISSSTMAVLIFALYISSPTIQALYTRPQVLWPVCPALLYWTSRIWIITSRGKMHHDPIVFALTDKASYLTFGVISLFFVLAHMLP